eukprot:1584803-Prymnesium_polylepis.1
MGRSRARREEWVGRGRGGKLCVWCMRTARAPGSAVGSAGRGTSCEALASGLRIIGAAAHTAARADTRV